MDYRVDFRDIQFQLFEWLETERLLESERFSDWDRESLEMVLAEALKIAKEQVGPTNEDGDRIGAQLVDGAVTTPDSFKPAYRTVAEGGWIGCINSPDLGGLGMPHVVGTVLTELFAGANLSLALVFLLTRGAAELAEDFGTEEVRNLFCEKLYSGEWTGTMCLTEAQAGSDVGASRAKAVKQENGRYLISGEKIFITFGEHDLTENVIHAVLARVEGALEGSRGLSLFIVPKFRVEEDGSLGSANDVVCGGIEHKLGIHGSPTCTMLFGQNGACEGFLLGEENKGMRLMFHMMNAARLEVGLQAQAAAAAAYESALAFAHERVQGRYWATMRDKDAPDVAIVEHPDVRRMLLLSSAYVQAMRALLLQTSYYIDQSHVAEGEERKRFHGWVEILTPICKAWASDCAFRVTEWSLQVYGGYGYTKDYPAEQYLRDVKIASIYEGTNGIQALDLVGRKIPAGGGEAFASLLAEVAKTVETLASHEVLAGPAKLLGEAMEEVRWVASEVPGREGGSLSLMLNAVPYLHMVGNVLGAKFLLDQAAIAHSRLDSTSQDRAAGEGRSEAAFLNDKVQAAIHFAYRVLPEVGAAAVAIRAGETAPMDASLQL